MKIYTTVAQEILDRYNEIVKREKEDERVIADGCIGDIISEILRDSCGEDEEIISARFLIDELHFLLCEALPSTAEEDVNSGVISKSTFYSKRKQWRKVYDDFVEMAEATADVSPRFIAEID